MNYLFSYHFTIPSQTGYVARGYGDQVLSYQALTPEAIADAKEQIQVKHGAVFNRMPDVAIQNIIKLDEVPDRL